MDFSVAALFTALICSIYNQNALSEKKKFLSERISEQLLKITQPHNLSILEILI